MASITFLELIDPTIHNAEMTEDCLTEDCKKVLELSDTFLIICKDGEYISLKGRS